MNINWVSDWNLKALHKNVVLKEILEESHMRGQVVIWFVSHT